VVSLETLPDSHGVTTSNLKHRTTSIDLNQNLNQAFFGQQFICKINSSYKEHYVNYVDWSIKI